MVDLLITILVSVAMVPLVSFTEGAPRIAVGIAFILFLPGYTLMAALFPRKGDIGSVERLALSFGLSLAVVPLVGLVLNYTPWGIRLYPIVLSLATFVLAMDSIAYYRRRRLGPDDRYEPRLRPIRSRLYPGWRGQNRWDRVLTLVLALAILGALASLAYTITTPKVGERFTEFYILGPDGKAEDYPGEMILGQEAKIRLGVVNNEHETTIYHIAVAIDGQRMKDIVPINLEHGQRWEEEVGFRPRKAGQNQKVEFLLYKGEASKLYRSLHLWINVKGRT